MPYWVEVHYRIILPSVAEVAKTQTPYLVCILSTYSRVRILVVTKHGTSCKGTIFGTNTDLGCCCSLFYIGFGLHNHRIYHSFDWKGAYLDLQLLKV